MSLVDYGQQKITVNLVSVACNKHYPHRKHKYLQTELYASLDTHSSGHHVEANTAYILS